MFLLRFLRLIILKPFCFKIVGLFFVVLVFLLLLFFENVFYSLTKALVEVEVKPRTRMLVGSSVSSRSGKWELVRYRRLSPRHDAVLTAPVFVHHRFKPSLVDFTSWHPALFQHFGRVPFWRP